MSLSYHEIRENLSYHWSDPSIRLRAQRQGTDAWSLCRSPDSRSPAFCNWAHGTRSSAMWTCTHTFSWSHLRTKQQGLLEIHADAGQPVKPLHPAPTQWKLLLPVIFHYQSRDSGCTILKLQLSKAISSCHNLSCLNATKKGACWRNEFIKFQHKCVTWNAQFFSI